MIDDDDRTAQGVEHLQAAAIEMIEAARAFLDVAEDFVADPEKVADTVSALGSLARVVSRGATTEAPADAAEDPIERITLS